MISPAPDEDVLEIPTAWRSRLHPRRGGTPSSKIKIDRAAAPALRALIEEHAAYLEESLAHPRCDSAMAAAARAHLAGAPDPLGAAVVTGLLLAGGPKNLKDRSFPMADAILDEHGAAFAARWLAESTEIDVPFHVGRDDDGEVKVERWAIPHRPKKSHWDWREESWARRIRAALAAADDATYAEAVAGLEGCRRSRVQRLITTYLVPTRLDWVRESRAEAPSDPYERTLLWCSLAPGEKTAWTDRWAAGQPWESLDLGTFATLADAFGAAIAPLAASQMVNRNTRLNNQQMAAKVLSHLPSDEAFEFLLDRADLKHARLALLDAARRFPKRARRLLEDASNNPSPEIAAQAAEVLALLGEDTSSETLNEVPGAELPPVLTDPPWLRKKKTAKPVVIEGLTAPTVRQVVWLPGEEEEWADPIPTSYGTYPDDTDWEKEAARVRSQRFPIVQVSHLLLQAPVDLVRPHIDTWVRLGYWYDDDGLWPRRVVARHGVDAYPLAISAAQQNPASWGGVLLPFLDNHVAELVTGWLTRTKTVRPLAIAWLGRHGAEAARLLIPAALGKAGRDRKDAEAALRVVAGNIGADAVVATTREYGDAAATAIEAMLNVDPLDVMPGRPPTLPDWAAPNSLPPVREKDGQRTLPREAVGHLITMLAMSKPDEPYAGVSLVRAACDPASLAEFGWELFQRWQLHGTPSKDRWAFSQLGLLGDDETVRRLTPVIRAWPGEGGHTKAVDGLDVLASIGTEAALAQLYGISVKMPFKALKTRAAEKMREVAAGLGLTPERLADRLVPDFGLDADGGLTLDYGPRRFTVTFDEQLMPYLTDEDGVSRKDLPKPAASDDAEKAHAARERFRTLKKDVRASAAEQIRRLEVAMIMRRRWTVTEFRMFFVDQPLIWHIARRLLWQHDGGAFRIAEDRTFSDVRDEIVTLPTDAEIGIPHPLDLPAAELAAWSNLFADYEIIQPFAQIGRVVHALTKDEHGERLLRFEGTTVPFGAVLGLERRGWRRADVGDNGIIDSISRELPDGTYATLHLYPGLVTGMLEESGDQEIRAVTAEARRPGGAPRRFGDLDPILVSEVIADLTDLTAPE
ncbi:DUF4132 domain-containing protein [Actinomadura rudentiformis]|uniref:DUF4132 domain-containing protein n=1 Tax=Actinomadura rudentiformis TaxID=359158 RepID=A0A6H9Z303_9ACTN|nr:DUF4132 domain-containing protein [Actinomadura rudentiformis]KAB2347740.1 DUF4132 domain-containing protein [Actinomadura rudentiformis]